MAPDRLLTPPFVLVSLANFLQGMAFSLFLHFPAFLLGLGAGEIEIGLIVGIAAVASIAIRPWVGAVMDTYGRRPIILAGNVLNVVVLALYPTIGALGAWVYVVRVLHGLAQAMLFTSLFTYGADVVPRSRLTEGLALFGVSGLLPIALAGVVGDIVLALADFDALFVVALALAVAALLAALPLGDVLGVGHDRALRRGFLSALALRDLVPLWWVTGTFSVVLAGYFTFLKTFVVETSVGSVGLFFGTYAGTAITLRLVAAWLPERVGPKRVLFPALGSLVVGFFVLAGATAAPAIGAAGVLCGAGHGFAFPILYSFVVIRAPEADRGSALAIFTSLFDVGTLVGGPLLGFVIDGFGYRSMFVTAGVMLAAGGAVYAWWDRAGTVAPTVSPVGG